MKANVSDARRSFTKTFECYARQLSRHMTILDVVYQRGVTWEIVEYTQHRDLGVRYSRLRALAFATHWDRDQIAVAKGQSLTIVVDRAGGVIAFVGDWKGCDAPIKFWSGWGPGRHGLTQSRWTREWNIAKRCRPFT
jgi:hypothetical protein